MAEGPGPESDSAERRHKHLCEIIDLRIDRSFRSPLWHFGWMQSETRGIRGGHSQLPAIAGTSPKNSSAWKSSGIGGKNPKCVYCHLRTGSSFILRKPQRQSCRLVWAAISTPGPTAGRSSFVQGLTTSSAVGALVRTLQWILHRLHGPVALILLSFGLGLPAHAQPASEPAGFIGKMTGHWVLVSRDIGREVKKRDPVFPGDRIQAKLPVAGASITIVLSSGTTQTVDCKQKADDQRKTDPCETVIVDDLPASRSVLERILAAATKLLFEEEAQPTVTMARSAFGPQPTVLALDQGQVDLTPALGQVPDGSYFAGISPEGKAASQADSLVPITIAPGSTPRITVREAHRGLYRLSLFANDGKENLGQPTLVLVADAHEAQTLREVFDRARANTMTWDEDLEARLIRQFLDDVLRVLAERGSGAS
jgi:hypothetical protein